MRLVHVLEAAAWYERHRPVWAENSNSRFKQLSISSRLSFPCSQHTVRQVTAVQSA
jgi:hypothetical protein